MKHNVNDIIGQLTWIDLRECIEWDVDYGEYSNPEHEFIFGDYRIIARVNIQKHNEENIFKLVDVSNVYFDEDEVLLSDGEYFMLNNEIEKHLDF